MSDLKCRIRYSPKKDTLIRTSLIHLVDGFVCTGSTVRLIRKLVSKTNRGFQQGEKRVRDLNDYLATVVSCYV